MDRLSAPAMDALLEATALAHTRKAWAEWLSQHEWTHFATLTFRYPSNRLARTREFQRWVRRLEQRAGRRLQWFRTTEWNTAGAHIHALVGNADNLPASAVRDAWRSGQSHAERYRSDLGAAYYLCKDMDFSERDEYDMSSRIAGLVEAVQGPAKQRAESSQVASDRSRWLDYLSREAAYRAALKRARG